MQPDTISVRVVTEAEVDADSADLTVVVEGSSVFSGSEALKKARELQALIDALKEAGVDEKRVKLRCVEVNSQSFTIIKTSSAKYVVSIKTVAVELLPQVLGTVASHKGAKLSRLTWNYGTLKATRSRLRREALVEAMKQARADAAALGVTVLGIFQLTEDTRGKDYNLEYIAGDSSEFLGVRSRSGPPEIGFHLGNSTTTTLDLRAEFRVSPMSDTVHSHALEPVAGPVSNGESSTPI